MAALPNPKREMFAQLLLRNLIDGTMSRGKAALAAAKSAGYGGSALADNARKWANQADVKARMAEIAAPIVPEQSDETLALDIAGAKLRLAKIIQCDSGLAKVKPADVIAAVRQLSTMEGWDAPKRMEHTGANGAPLLDEKNLSDDQLARLETFLVALVGEDTSGEEAPGPEGQLH